VRLVLIIKKTYRNSYLLLTINIDLITNFHFNIYFGGNYEKEGFRWIIKQKRGNNGGNSG